ncbi:MAG: hypothetical protein SGPRY_002292 [Prymnesium sp.]
MLLAVALPLARPGRVGRLIDAARSELEIRGAYACLARAGSLSSFGAAKSSLPLSAAPLSSDDLCEATQLPCDAFIPSPSRRASVMSADLPAGLAVAALQLVLAREALEDQLPLRSLRSLEWWQLPTLFLAIAACATLVVAVADSFALGGNILATAQASLPHRRRVIIRHEGGHFLLSVLLGCPVRRCELNPLAGLKDPSFEGVAGTVFDAPALEEIQRGETPSDDAVNIASVILMGGIAAEAMAYGCADGGAADERALKNLLVAARQAGPEEVRAHARWAVANAVLLLREYSHEHDALCDKLAEGASVGECVEEIELAAVSRVN